MKISIVFCAVNDNPEYYRFIPMQIYFWRTFGMKFIVVFVGNSIPEELTPFRDNIILWNLTPELNSAYVAQNLRLYFPALISAGDENAAVLITDMDMLPANKTYYTDGLDSFDKEDFIYYREPYENKELYMCYNAATPATWGKVFNIRNKDDIVSMLRINYELNSGVLGTEGWTTDQRTLYKYATKYSQLKILRRPVRRLETWIYAKRVQNGDKDFFKEYDDAHFHRSFERNKSFILNAKHQIDVRQRSLLTVISNRKLVFLTFGGPSSNYIKRVKTLCEQASNFGRFDRVIGATDRILRSDSVFWKKNGVFMNINARGYGYYIWKPFLIQKILNQLNDGDILVYMDSGCTLNVQGIRRFDEYLEMITKPGPGMISFHMAHLPEIQYSKRALIEYLETTSTDLRSGQYVGGIQMMCKSPNTVKLVNNWYSIANRHELIDDSRHPGGEHGSFIDHRHDQSIYSLLVKKYGTISIPDETYFGSDWGEGNAFPFLATRLK